MAYFGIEYNGFLQISVKPNQVNEFIEDIKNIAGEFNVRCQELNEKYNVVVWSPIKSLRDLENLRESLKPHSAVTEIRTSIWTYMKVSPDNLALET